MARRGGGRANAGVAGIRRQVALGAGRVTGAAAAVAGLLRPPPTAGVCGSSTCVPFVRLQAG
ncbi:MAG: hypothetical protein ACYDAQ_09320, partial [Mycobacteriales bacterium]